MPCRVDEHRVESAAGREAAHGQVQGGRAAGGRQPESGPEIDPRQRASPSGSVQRGIDAVLEDPRRRDRMPATVEDGRTRPTRDVGAEPDVQSLVERGAKGKHGIGEIEVRQGAVGDAGAHLADEIHVVRGDEVRVRENGVAPQQAEVMQCERIRSPEAFQHEGMFPVALRAMSLHVTGGLVRDGSETLEQPVGAGRDEPGRDDGANQAILVAGQAVDVVDQVPGPLHGRVRGRVTVVVGTLLGIIHGHLADERSLPLREADVGEAHRAFEMYGGKVDGGGRAVCQQRVDQRRIDALGVGALGILRFQGEGTLQQPLIEGQVQRLAELRPLRSVDVQVDQSGQQVPPVSELVESTAATALGHRRRVARFAGAMHGVDGSRRIDRDDGIVHDLDLAPAGRVHERSAKRESCGGISHSRTTPRWPAGCRTSAAASVRHMLRHLAEDAWE